MFVSTISRRQLETGDVCRSACPGEWRDKIDKIFDVFMVVNKVLAANRLFIEPQRNTVVPMAHRGSYTFLHDFL